MSTSITRLIEGDYSKLDQVWIKVSEGPNKIRKMRVVDMLNPESAGEQIASIKDVDWRVRDAKEEIYTELDTNYYTSATIDANIDDAIEAVNVELEENYWTAAIIEEELANAASDILADVPGIIDNYMQIPDYSNMETSSMNHFTTSSDVWEITSTGFAYLQLSTIAKTDILTYSINDKVLNFGYGYASQIIPVKAGDSIQLSSETGDIESIQGLYIPPLLTII